MYNVSRSSVEQTLLQQQTQQSRPPSNTQQRHINTSLNPINPNSIPSSHSPSGLNKASPSASSPSSGGPNVASSLLANNFNLASSAPVTAQDYNNLAWWNQLTPAQRLLLTQQFKNTGGALGNNANKSPFPPLPSLPLDTDLITMLDYNPNKPKSSGSGQGNNNNPPVSIEPSPRNNGQFTKPHVPPLIPVNNLETQQRKSSRSQPATAQSSSSSSTTVNLNSSAALEDFEKKFKMNDEMRAVVQKVLSNPDLSTFIQTNASNTFVPFISPPISPANSGTQITLGSGTSVSIVPNPHVTITPQLPSHFAHSSSAHSPSASSASSTSSSTGGNRQKSVICSTGVMGGPHSPSPGRTKTSTTYSYNQQQQQQQLSSSSSSTPTPMEVIDLSSPRRSLQAASAYLQQQHQQQAAAIASAQQQHNQQQQRLAAAAAAQHHQSQQNGRNSSNSSSAQQQANSASMHLQRHAAMAAAAAADNTQRLNIIPEIPASNLNLQPYKVQKVYVESHLVPCINMKAYNDSEQLMTLTDFQKYFYPNIALDQCKRLMEALGVELYKGNR